MLNIKKAYNPKNNPPGKRMAKARQMPWKLFSHVRKNGILCKEALPTFLSLGAALPHMHKKQWCGVKKVPLRPAYNRKLPVHLETLFSGLKGGTPYNFLSIPSILDGYP